ncbi:hypothetical protein CV014_24995 [Nostoc sp. CMAA1605]|nr:hypothetical protein [Nostoc sp. CMAA1605]
MQQYYLFQFSIIKLLEARGEEFCLSSSFYSLIDITLGLLYTNISVNLLVLFLQLVSLTDFLDIKKSPKLRIHILIITRFSIISTFPDKLADFNH